MKPCHVATAIAVLGSVALGATQDKAQAPKQPPALTEAYRKWIAAQPVPILEGYGVEDTRTQPLGDWPQIGGRGAYLHLGDNTWLDSAIYEIPANAKLKPRKRFVEEIVYVLAGRGSTTIQQQGHRRDTVEWQEGSLFTPPLNVTYEYANTDPAKPARLLVFSAFPLVTQIAGNASYVNDVTYTFNERYNAEENFFRKSERAGNRLWKTNFIKDVREFKLDTWDFRGAGNSSMFWQMADNRLLSAHVSTFPSGTYKKAHRHPNEALIYILKGKGYSLIWHNKGEKPTKMAWHEGSLIVAPYFWYHQHFNTGDTPASYLAITPGKLMGVLLHTTIDEDTGGGGDPSNQIEYTDEDPEIRTTFEREVGHKVILK